MNFREKYPEKYKLSWCNFYQHGLGGMDSESSGHVPAIYVAKYNRFVDNILGKINNILRANYEPVTVKLTNPNSSTKTSKNKNKNKTKKKGTKNGTKKSASRPIDTSAEKNDNENDVEVWFAIVLFPITK